MTEEMSNALQKCFRFVDMLIEKAKKERDKKGYRENLGYDQEGKLSVYLSQVSLSYSEQAQVLEYFWQRCDQI